jgi:hypothetical protein
MLANLGVAGRDGFSAERDNVAKSPKTFAAEDAEIAEEL